MGSNPQNAYGFIPAKAMYIKSQETLMSSPYRICPSDLQNGKKHTTRRDDVESIGNTFSSCNQHFHFGEGKFTPTLTLALTLTLTLAPTLTLTLTLTLNPYSYPDPDP
jgi:hypothetical protein